MFVSCHSLESITLSKNINEIGRSSFSSCTSLKTITYYGLTEPIYDSRSFSGCSSLEIVNVPINYDSSKIDIFCGMKVKLQRIL